MLLSAFKSQVGQHWFTPELFFGLMTLRGIECCADSGYAEAFHSRKAIMSVAKVGKRRGGRQQMPSNSILPASFRKSWASAQP